MNPCERGGAFMLASPLSRDRGDALRLSRARIACPFSRITVGENGDVRRFHLQRRSAAVLGRVKGRFALRP